MMNRTFRYGYVQAKLHGLIGASFIRRDISPLVRAGDARQVAHELFPGREYTLPEKALVRALQSDLDERLFAVIRRVLTALDPAPPVIVQLLRGYEYRMIRSFVSSLVRVPAEARSEASIAIQPYWDLGPFATLRSSAPGELSLRSLESSPFAWIPSAMGGDGLFEIDGRLDRNYYQTLLDLAHRVPRGERDGVLDLVQLEARLQNYIWILRLRSYFKMHIEQIVPLLVPVGSQFPDKDTQALLDVPLDNQEALRTLRVSWLYEDQFAADFRVVDPARAELQAELRLYRKAKRYFYGNPFTLELVYAFCKLKQFELSRVTTVLEGMKMSLSETELLAATHTL